MAVVRRVVTFLLMLVNPINVFTDVTLKTDSPDSYKFNTVIISTLVRNKEHTLPFFLAYLERLDYPKDRIALLFFSDHNVDRSVEILNKWIHVNKNYYHNIETVIEEESTPIIGEDGVAHWPYERYTHIINLREKSISWARQSWADYIWVLDADVFLTNPDTLYKLIKKQKIITAPMLRSDGLYSNFWCGMTPDFYYMRTEEYSQILGRKKKGCFNVPMVHSSVLIDLRAVMSDNLTYNPANLQGYAGPHDDIITFARSANMSGVEMYVCNDDVYGYVMVPMEKDDQLSYDLLQLRNLKLEVLVDSSPLESNEFLQNYVVSPVEGRIPVDKTFMINLIRRPDRRKRMESAFAELHLDATLVNAVDGQLLTDGELKRLGVKLMPGYTDPYHKRPMKRGEIGCFLSHYNIWKEVAENDYNVVMVLEDDVRFEPFFNQKMISLLEELRKLSFEWDLVYLGRKRLDEKNEEPVRGARNLLWAGYSYWTLGYLLTSRGARKLTAQDPLSNIIPVDEYLPILYDKHPEDDWKKFFPLRNLVALSVDPLTLYPAWYLHEEGYVSDTEDSPTITTTPRPEL